MNLTKEQLQLLLDSFKKHIDDETEKSVQELDKTLDTVVAKLVCEGWTLPANLPISAINALGKTNELDNVNDFMKLFYYHNNYQNMRALISGIKSAKISVGLVKVIDECWQAFQQKMYAICATSLISVIEGILSEFSSDKKDVRMMKVCQYQVDNMPHDSGTIVKHVWISYNQFIRQLYDKTDFTAVEPDNINRHWLLHGRSKFDIDEIDCMRLFNAIHTLCMVVNIKKNTSKS